MLATIAAADRNFERAGNNGGVSGVQPASGRVRVVPSDAAHLPVMPRDVDVAVARLARRWSALTVQLQATAGLTLASS